VLYEFAGEEAQHELSVGENELITVVCQDVGEGWVEAVKDDGKQGLVPASYIEYLDEGSVEYDIVEPPPPSAPFEHQPSQGEEEWSDYDSDEEGPRPSVDGEAYGESGHSHRSNTIKKSMNRFTPYVKSGAEEFIMGNTKVEVNQNQTIAIIREDGRLMWNKAKLISVEITQPTKKQKFKGIKSYMSYHITPTTTNLTVERRYKQFDWFHGRLEEKFPCFIIPPLPDKAITGKFQEEFIEQRREKLEQWLNRIGRHPVIANSQVTNHFLQCRDEKAWKNGKRAAESDDTARAGFFLTVSTDIQLPNILESESYISSFATFSKKMSGNLDRLVSHNEEYTNRMMGGTKSMYQKYGLILKELGDIFNTGPLSDSKPVNKAIISTSKSYLDIAAFHDEQPRLDAHILSESVREYQGLLGSVPDMLHVQKGAAQRVKDFTKNEEHAEPGEAQQIMDRYDTSAHLSRQR